MSDQRKPGRVDGALAALRAEEATLTREITQLTSRRDRIRYSIIDLEGLSRPPTALRLAHEFITAYAATLPAGATIQSVPVMRWAREHGWRGGGSNPQGAISAALTRLDHLGKLKRVKRGVYKTLPNAGGPDE